MTKRKSPKKTRNSIKRRGKRITLGAFSLACVVGFIVGLLTISVAMIGDLKTFSLGMLIMAIILFAAVQFFVGIMKLEMKLLEDWSWMLSPWQHKGIILVFIIIILFITGSSVFYGKRPIQPNIQR